MSKTVMDKEGSHGTLFPPTFHLLELLVADYCWERVIVFSGVPTSEVPCSVNNDTLIAHEGILVKLSES